MESARFDVLTRSVRSRRAALPGLAASLAALLGLARPEDGAAHTIPLARCRKIKEAKPRRACLRRARAHNATHRPPSTIPTIPPDPPPPPRQPNAACEAGENVPRTSGPSRRYAQTFTEPNGGRLTQVQLYFARADADTSGSYRLQVNTVDQAGAPTNITIGTAQVPASAVSRNQDLVYFAFDPAPPLVAGRQYALVLSRVGTPTALTEFSVERPGPCPGGEIYVGDSANPGLFAPDADSDTFYRTWVSP